MDNIFVKKKQTDTQKNIFEKLKATTLAEIYQDSRFRLPISVYIDKNFNTYWTTVVIISVPYLHAGK